MTENQHLKTLYHQLQQDRNALRQELAELTQAGQAMKKQLAAEGHLDLSSYSETLESFANIEANNRQVDTLNARYHTAQTRLQHAELLLPQAYFAKLDLDFGDGDQDQLYLGKVGYTDADANDLVYDWRAPVANVYYANKTGATTYLANGRQLPVAVLGRTQFVIDHDQLLNTVQTDTAIGDPLLLATLAADRSGGLQEITATIQAEQNAIIRETAHHLVFVDGVAGSGKTSVLLQRVAYQLYVHRGDWAPEHMLVLTPNLAFSRYIKGVLPALGEAEPMTTTYAQFVKQLGARFGLTPVVAEQQIVAIAECLDQPLATAPAGVAKLAYAQSDAQASFLARMQRGWRWLVATDQVPADLTTWLDWDALAATWGLKALSDLDRLYLLVMITEYHQDAIKAVFVDEAQDYDEAVWRFLAAVFAKAEMTIVGDHCQQLATNNLPAVQFFKGSAIQLRLNTSYRATGAITTYFAQYAGDWADKIQAVQPIGQPVQVLANQALPAVLASLDADPGQIVGIITPDAEQAEVVAQTLPAAQLLTAGGRKALTAGINVMPLAVAKGLECDYVVVLEWDSDYYQDAEFGANRRYVAASRATKSLRLAGGGQTMG